MRKVHDFRRIVTLSLVAMLGVASLGQAVQAADDSEAEASSTAETAQIASQPENNRSLSDAEIDALQRTRVPSAPSVTTFSGRVTDQSGALVSGVSINLWNQIDECNQDWGELEIQPPDYCYRDLFAEDGTFSTTLPDGEWGGRLNPPSGSSYVSRDIDVLISGGVEAIYSSGQPFCGTDADQACASTIVIPLLSANFEAIVVDGSGTPVERAWVNVEQWSPGGSSGGSYPWVSVAGVETQTNDPEWGGVETSVPGLVTLPFSEATYYMININKPWDGGYDVAKTRYIVEVTEVPGSGNITSASLCTWTDNGSESAEPSCSGSLASSGGRFVLPMDTPNFRIQVCLPGSGAGCAPVAAWINYELCADDEYGDFRCTGVGGVDADEDGHGSLFIEESGTYRFRISPSWDYTGPAIATTVLTAEIEVSGSGALNVSGLSASSGRYVMRFNSPNVVGTLLYPDDGSELAGTPVEHTWVEITQWDSEMGRYEWNSDVEGTHIERDGEFALLLPAGDYRVRFQGKDGYAARTLYVHVDSATKACVGEVSESDSNELGLAPTDGFTCSSAETFYGMTLELPNVRGVLLAGLDPVAWGHVDIQSWNEEFGYWEWSGSWMNTDEDGRFASKFDANGAYKLNFDAPWGSTEYARTAKYLVVCSNGSAVAYASSQSVATAWDCANPTTAMSTTLSDNIQLDGANVVGQVVYEGGPLADVWIDFQYCTDDGGCQWETGMNSRRVWGNPDSELNGTFGGALADKDTTDTASTKYEMNLNPPPTDAAVVRARYDVYVYSEWADGRSWCLGASNYSEPDGVPTCAEGALYGADTPVTLTMKAGNMPGRVVTPDADCSSAVDANSCPGIGDSWIEVQQWKAFSWNTSEYGWEWTDYGSNTLGWGNVDRIGNFNIDLPPSEGDALNYYRVTANPSWNNSAGYAKRTVVVAVNSDGNWCQMSADDLASIAEDPRSSSSPYSQSCTPDGSNDNASDAVNGLTARLVDANIRGTLYAPDGETPVGDAHIGVERITEQNWCGEDVVLNEGDPDEDGDGIPDWCIGEWSEWLGGSNTLQRGDNKGEFAISIVEPGTYRLRVETPWNWSGDVEVAPFRVDFTIEASGNCVSGNTDPEACDVSGIGTENTWTYVEETQRFVGVYPTPTLYGTLYDKDGTTAVRGGWLSVHEASTGNWVDGTGTGWDGSRKGRFAISLDDGSYEVEFWPSWDDLESGVRNVVAVTVTDGVAAMTSDGGSYDGGCPEGTDVTNQDTCLRTPAINGPVLYREDGCESTDCATRMPYAHAEAVVCEEGENPWECEWVDWGNTEEDTETRPAALRMALDDGTYTLRVFPNWDVKQTREMELAVVIADGKLDDCEYSFGGSCYTQDAEGNKSFAADFDAVPPNVFLRVEGTGGHTIDSSRYLLVETCASANFDSETETCSEALGEEGRFLAKYSTLREKPTLDLFMDFGDDDPSDNNQVLDVSTVYKVTLLTLDGTDDASSSGKVAWVTQPSSTDDGDSRLTTLTAAAAS